MRGQYLLCTIPANSEQPEFHHKKALRVAVRKDTVHNVCPINPSTSDDYDGQRKDRGWTGIKQACSVTLWL